MKALARPGGALPGGWAPPGNRVAWTAETLPQELLDILDARAGKAHSRSGPVVLALVDILNAYDTGSFRS